MGATLGLPPRKIKATSRSFQTHINWKIPSDASAGTDNGRAMVQNVRQVEAPSTYADSIISLGSVAKKLRSRKTAKGRPKAVCAIQIATYVPVNPIAENTVKTGPRAICDGTTSRPTTPKKIQSRPGNFNQAKA